MTTRLALLGAGKIGDAIINVHRRQRSARHATLAAAEKLADRRHRHFRVAQARNNRVDAMTFADRVVVMRHIRD